MMSVIMVLTTIMSLMIMVVVDGDTNKDKMMMMVVDGDTGKDKMVFR